MLEKAIAQGATDIVGEGPLFPNTITTLESFGYEIEISDSKAYWAVCW